MSTPAYELPQGVRDMFRSMGISITDGAQPPPATPSPAAPMPPAPAQPTPAAKPAPDPATQVAPGATTKAPTAQMATPEQALGLVDPVEPADYIPPLYWNGGDYLFNRCPALYKAGHPILVLMTGPRGTGKTLAAEVVAARLGLRLLKCDCGAISDGAELLGTSRLDFKRGGDYYLDGPIVASARFNSALLLDEITMLPSQRQAMLNPLMDRARAGIYVPYTGERVVWSQPVVIATCNIGYAGNRKLQEALQDRFETVVTDYLPEDAEIRLLMGRTGIPGATAQRAVKAANAIRAAARGESGQVPIDFDLSPRALFSFGHRIAAGQPEHLAWKEAVINRIGHSLETAALEACVEDISRVAGMLSK